MPTLLPSPSPLRRKLVAALIGTTLMLGLTTGALSTTGVAHAETAGANETLDTCALAHKSISVLFLVDTSISLGKTDSRNERVSAIMSALSALGALQSSTKVEVRSEFLEFGSTTHRSFPATQEWSLLPTGFLEQAALALYYTDKHKSQDTDYVSALEPYTARDAKPANEVGAIEMLERAPQGSCRLMVWFTDGQFSLDYFRTTKTVHWTDPPTQIRSDADGKSLFPKAVDRICRPNGLADQIRSGDITKGSSAQIAIVALDNGAEPQNFDFIQSIVTGTGKSGPCGNSPARGSFEGSTSIGDLAIQLREALLGPSHGPEDGDRPSCPDSARNGCGFDPQNPTINIFDYPFSLATGITKFNLLTLSGDPSVKTTLVTPQGLEYPLGDLSDGDTSEMSLANGAKIHLQRLKIGAGGYLLDALLPTSGGGAGLWRIRYSTKNPAAAAELNKASIYVFGNLQARLVNTEVALRRGRAGTITVELISDADVHATDSSFLDGSSLDLKVNGESIAAPSVNGDGTFSFVYEVPKSYTGDTVAVSATLRPVIRLSDSAPPVPLAQWEGELGKLSVKSLPKYPLVEAPVPFKAPITQKQRLITTQMHVDARAEEAGGCLSLESITPPSVGGTPIEVRVTVLDGTREIAVGEACSVKLDSGQEKQLSVQFSATNLKVSEAARISAAIAIRSTSQLDITQSEDFTVEIGAEVDPIFNTSTGNTVWLLLLVAALIPIVMLYLGNALVARFDVGRMTFAELPVRFVNGEVRRLVSGEPGPLVLEDDDIRLTPIADEGRYQTVRVGAASLRGKVSFNPFRDVYGQAKVDGMPFVVSTRGSNKTGSKGRLEASLSQAWVFHSPEAPQQVGEGLAPLDGTLTLVIPPFPQAARQQLLDLREEVNHQVDRAVRAHAPVQAPGSPESGAGINPKVSAGPGPEDSPAVASAEFDWDGTPLSSATIASSESSDASRRKLSRKEKKANKAALLTSSPAIPPVDDLPF